MGEKKPYAIITGASRGLGKSFAIELASRGHHLILVSKTDEKLNNTGSQISSEYNVDVKCYRLDLTIENELMEFITEVKSKFKINVLINNAGIGCTTEFDNTSLNFVDSMIGLNIRALTILIHQLLPELRKQDFAYILNVGSMAAYSPIAFKSIYPATKRYVHNFSLGLAEELKESGISVSVLNPGGMNTNEFVTKRNKNHGFMARISVIPTDIVAQIAINKMFRGKKVIVVGLGNKLLRTLMNIFPTPIKIKLISNNYKKEISLTSTDTETSLYR